MTDHDDELFRLQQTLYDSRNPTASVAAPNPPRLDRRCDRTMGEWIAIARSRSVPAPASTSRPSPRSPRRSWRRTWSAAYLDRLVPAASACGAELVWDDITDSHFTDAEFDLVLCSEVIEHIPDGPAALREIRRILDPEGVLVLSTPQRYSLLEVASKVAFLPGFIQVARRVYREP